MSNETRKAALAALPKPAAGLIRLSMAVLFVLFGWATLAHANLPAIDAALVSYGCDEKKSCDGLPDAPSSAKPTYGLPAVGDGNEPTPSAMPASAGYVLPLPSFDGTGVAILATALLPDGRNSRLFDSRAPPRRS